MLTRVGREVVRIVISMDGIHDVQSTALYGRMWQPRLGLKANRHKALSIIPPGEIANLHVLPTTVLGILHT